MGDVYVEIELENYADRLLAGRGHLEPGAIRGTRVKALTDTGAVMMVLPEDLVDALGLERWDRVMVTYADERREQRDTAGPLLVRVGRRRMVT
ncbi:MAG: aspartyl protease family protein, partial [Firmicutes bacterium]|nr:aspartyl protease family protein [Bacillota bacterium]